jgi:hypothetical protein
MAACSSTRVLREQGSRLSLKLLEEPWLERGAAQAASVRWLAGIPRRVVLLVRTGEDDGIVQGHRLLQSDVSAERITEPVMNN